MHQLDQAHDKIRKKTTVLEKINLTKLLDADNEEKNPTSNLLKPVMNPKERIYELSEKPAIDPKVLKKLRYENSTLQERLEQAVHLADMHRNALFYNIIFIVI